MGGFEKHLCATNCLVKEHIFRLAKTSTPKLCIYKSLRSPVTTSNYVWDILAKLSQIYHKLKFAIVESNRNPDSSLAYHPNLQTKFKQMFLQAVYENLLV